MSSSGNLYNDYVLPAATGVKNTVANLFSPQDMSGLPYDAQVAALARRQKLAEMLMQQGQAQPEVMSYKGIAAQPSVAGGIGRALSQFMGAYMGGKAEEDLATAKAKEGQKFTDRMNNYYELPDTSKNFAVTGGLDLSTGKRGPDVSAVDQSALYNRIPTTGQQQAQSALTLIGGGGPYAGIGASLLSEAQKKIAVDTERQRIADQEKTLTKPANVSDAAWTSAGNVPGMRTDLFKSNSVKKYGDYAQDLIDSGITPGTPAFNQAMADRRRKETYIAPVTPPAPGTPQSYIIDGKPVFTTPQAALAMAQKGSKVTAAGGAQATEGERKAATLFGRMRFSQDQLKTAITESPDAALPPAIGSFAGSVNPVLGNLATSEARQRVEAAQLDILDAALTLGTGAAYTKEQLEGYRKSYFPQYGDRLKNIADKKDRLDNVIKQAEIAAGRAFKPDKPTQDESPPLNLLKEGQNTTFDDGQVWTLQGGKAVKVN